MNSWVNSHLDVHTTHPCMHNSFVHIFMLVNIFLLDSFICDSLILRAQVCTVGVDVKGMRKLYYRLLLFLCFSPLKWLCWEIEMRGALGKGLSPRISQLCLFHCIQKHWATPHLLLSTAALRLTTPLENTTTYPFKSLHQAVFICQTMSNNWPILSKTCCILKYSC